MYDENIVLSNGVKLYGGYAPDFFGRDVLLHPTTLRGTDASTSQQVGAVSAVGLGKGNPTTVVSGFHIVGRNPTERPCFSCCFAFTFGCGQWAALFNRSPAHLGLLIPAG